jgi:hypothetical protein
MGEVRVMIDGLPDNSDMICLSRFMQMYVFLSAWGKPWDTSATYHIALAVIPTDVL